MSIFTLGFLFGIVLLFHLTTLPNILLITLLAGIMAMLNLRYRHPIYFFPMGFMLGLCYATLFAHCFLSPFIPHQLENKKLTIHGYISNFPEKKEHYQSFLFKTKDLTSHNETLQLSWNNPEINLSPGEKWQLTVKLKQPHTLANPGSFDAESFALEYGVSAKGYVLDSMTNKLLATTPMLSPLSNLRDRIRQDLLKVLPNNIHGAVFIPTLSIGDRELLNKDDWQILQATGTNHLVAIAGLHVGLLSSVIFFLTQLFWRRFPALILLNPVNCAAAFMSIIVGTVYCALAGFSLPTQRALVMLAAFMLGIFLRRKIPAWHSYWLAMLIVLLLNPANVLSASFWLSFSAVASIIWMLSYRRGKTSFWRQNIHLQIAVSLGVLPCTIFFFHNASLISPIANAIVVPWVGLLVVPLSLLGTLFSLFCPSIAHAILFLAAYCMQLAWWFLQWLTQFSYSAIPMIFNNPLCLIWMSCAIFLLVFPRGLPIRYLSGFFLLPIFFQVHPKLPEQTIRLTVLEVGQGLSCIIQTKEHVLVYDTGSAQTDGFDAGRDVIFPFMQYAGIHKVDTLLISHGDNDHSGGAFFLLKNIPIKQLITSVPALFQNYPMPITNCQQNLHWNWDGVDFDLFANGPLNFAKGNNASCVLRVSSGQHAILLPGDIEKLRESQLLSQSTLPLKADILLAPHHGSNTSSSAPFVKQAHPQLVIYSTGYLNRFHFPNPKVMQRYQAIGAQEFNTAKTGMIQILMGQNGLISASIARTKMQEWWRSHG